MEENLSRFAAIVSISGHVVEDMTCANTNTQLLNHPQDNHPFRLVSNLSSDDVEGCYLMYDQINKYWIRSGKVVGITRNMAVCRVEHVKAVMKFTAGTSNLYKTYPHSTNPNVVDSLLPG